MTYRPTILGVLFFGLALVLAGCEVIGVYEYVSEQAGGLYVMVGSCIIAAVTPGLPALADWFGRGRHRLLQAGTWIGFAVCLLIVMSAAMQRTGAAADTAQQTREAAERRMRIAEAAERQAVSDYEAAQAAALRECASGRQRRCMDAEAKAAELRAVLARARAALVAAPAGAQLDPLAHRLASILPISEDRVRLLQPLLVPIALSILSALFFAGWSRLDFDAAETVRAAPLPPHVRHAEPAQAGKFGAVAGFLVNRTEPVRGASIEVERDLYNAYVEWCRIGGVQPHPKQAFALELAQVGKAAGLVIEIRGQAAYCLDRRFAA